MKALICNKEVEIKSASEVLTNGEKILRVSIENETLTAIEALVTSDEFDGITITSKSGSAVDFGENYTNVNALMRMVTDMSDEIVLELGASNSVVQEE